MIKSIHKVVDEKKRKELFNKLFAKYITFSEKIKYK